MGDKIIETLTSCKEGNTEYVFVSKTGMNLEFETNQTEADKAIDLTKKIIRSQEYGGSLYFRVTTK